MIKISPIKKYSSNMKQQDLNNILLLMFQTVSDLSYIFSEKLGLYFDIILKYLYFH